MQITKKIEVSFVVTMLLLTLFSALMNIGSVYSQDSQMATGVMNLDFVDENNGWAVGCAGLILSTNDGGLNWKLCKWQYSGDLPCTLTKVKFVDLYNGWAIGCERIDGLMYGIIIYTSDSGTTWEIQMTWREGGDYGWYDLYGIEFINATYGWVGGQYCIFRTVDGGLNWIRQLSPWGHVVFDIHFMDENNGLACGTTIWRTNDGGETWSRISGEGLYYNMDFVDSQNVWVISGFGEIIHSEDGGNSWVQQYDTGGPILTDVDFVNTTHGWVTCNDGRIFHTNNGGATYDFDSFVDDRDWRGLYVDNNSGEAKVYAVGGTWQTAFGGSNCLLAVIEKSGSLWEVQLAPSMVFKAEKDEEVYQVKMDADSTLTEFSFVVSTGSINFNVFGPNGYHGSCKITIPKSLVGIIVSNFNVYIDGIKASCSMTETDTEYVVNISYGHSSHDVQVTPIFPDIDRDGEIGLSDLVLLAKAYDSRLGYPNWDLRCDLNGNGKVGLSDLVILARNYGKE